MLLPRTRRILPAAALLCGTLTGCRLFKPVDPNGSSEPKRAPEQTTAPAASATTTEASSPAPEIRQPEPAAPSAPKEIGALHDQNIAAMLLASNYTDISYAQLVPARAERTDVKDFAKRMLTDHTGVNMLVRDLLTKLDLTPEDNTASLDMRDESSERRDALRELNGYAFDSTYIENEVRYHQRFLTAIDDVMLPHVRNDELRTLLSSIRPAVAAHLAHAEQVRANVLSKK
ncbi:MAG TPA: DUF4142 domain-containing protein [Gemmatimonadaceae bacterium]|nr:DUF4142 domain-containing protein [Gemmatimonadaceae bacterium]